MLKNQFSYSEEEIDYFSENMAHRISPPVFGGSKSYDRWKEEISAWELVSKVEKKDMMQEKN